MQHPETTKMVASQKTKVKLLRDQNINGNSHRKGDVVEVDAEMAEQLTKKFPVPTQFFGTRSNEEVTDEVKYSQVAVKV